MVDAQVSGTCEGFLVKVQVFSRAPIKKALLKSAFFVGEQLNMNQLSDYSNFQNNEN